MTTETKTKSEDKYILRLSQVRAAVTKLPDPLSTDQNTFSITQDGYDIPFEKMIITKNGEKTYRWSYKGRIFVDLKYTEKSEK